MRKSLIRIDDTKAFIPAEPGLVLVSVCVTLDDAGDRIFTDVSRSPLVAWAVVGMDYDACGAGGTLLPVKATGVTLMLDGEERHAVQRPDGSVWPLSDGVELESVDEFVEGCVEMEKALAESRRVLGRTTQKSGG